MTEIHFQNAVVDQEKLTDDRPSDRLRLFQFIVSMTSVVMFQWNLPCALFSFRRLLRSTLLPSGSR